MIMDSKCFKSWIASRFDKRVDVHVDGQGAREQ